MKKIFTILSIAFSIAVIAPSCSSSDENFEDVVSNSQLDQTAPTGKDGGEGQKPGG